MSRLGVLSLLVGLMSLLLLGGCGFSGGGGTLFRPEVTIKLRLFDGQGQLKTTPIAPGEKVYLEFVVDNAADRRVLPPTFAAGTSADIAPFQALTPNSAVNDPEIPDEIEDRQNLFSWTAVRFVGTPPVAESLTESRILFSVKSRQNTDVERSFELQVSLLRFNITTTPGAGGSQSGGIVRTAITGDFTVLPRIFDENNVEQTIGSVQYKVVPSNTPGAPEDLVSDPNWTVPAGNQAPSAQVTIDNSPTNAKLTEDPFVTRNFDLIVLYFRPSATRASIVERIPIEVTEASRR